MSKYLSSLVTADTPLLYLEDDENIKIEEKLKVLDINSGLCQLYTSYMKFHNGTWYYFKKDFDNIIFKFHIIDELMGSYLAKIRNLPTVDYTISTFNDVYGLASVNFKKKEFKYYSLKDLVSENLLYRTENSLIEELKKFTINSKNQKTLLKHLFSLYALDIQMIQFDRTNFNIQFSINNETKFFDIAPIYDYSSCLDKMKDGINLRAVYGILNSYTIHYLAEQYPEFKQALELSLEISMEETWNQICEDYHFNMCSSAYYDICKHYIIKDEKQKEYIKSII